jgi:hypothetical protein
VACSWSVSWTPRQVAGSYRVPTRRGEIVAEDVQRWPTRGGFPLHPALRRSREATPMAAWSGCRRGRIHIGLDQGAVELASALRRGDPWSLGLVAAAGRTGRRRPALGISSRRSRRRWCGQPGTPVGSRAGACRLVGSGRTGWGCKLGVRAWRPSSGRDRAGRQVAQRSAASWHRRCNCTLLLPVWCRRPASVVGLNYLSRSSCTASVVALEPAN